MRLNFKTLSIALAACLVCLGGIRTAPAQETTGVMTMEKVGYVDLQRIMGESMEGKEAKKQVEAYFARKQQELDEAQSDMLKAEKEFNEQKFVLTEEAAQKKQDELNRKKIALKRMFEDAEYGLQTFQEKVTENIKNHLFTVIEKYGKENGYAMILNKTPGVFLYADSKADITDSILKAYDALQKTKTAAAK